jgi:hypothetical protein
VQYRRTFRDFTIVKFDPDGSLMWQQNVNGTDKVDDRRSPWQWLSSSRAAHSWSPGSGENGFRLMALVTDFDSGDRCYHCSRSPRPRVIERVGTPGNPPSAMIRYDYFLLYRNTTVAS